MFQSFLHLALFSRSFVTAQEQIPTPPPSPGCSVLNAAVLSGYPAEEDFQTHEIEHNGLNRTWITYVPSSSTTTYGPLPLVLVMHGFGGCAFTVFEYMQWKDLADTEGFILVSPQGLEGLFTEGTATGVPELDAWFNQPGWNAGGCCGGTVAAQIDDVDFLAEIISAEAGRHDIDLNRVYMGGHSNGCALAQLFAAQRSDLLAGVVCQAFYLLGEPSPTYRAVPIVEIHCYDDDVVDYWNTVALPPISLVAGASATGNMEQWAALNGCAAEPEVVESSVDGQAFATTTYTSCDGNTELQLVSIEGCGHYPFSSTWNNIESPANFDTTAWGWEFIKRFTNVQADPESSSSDRSQPPGHNKRQPPPGQNRGQGRYAPGRSSRGSSQPPGRGPAHGRARGYDWERVHRVWGRDVAAAAAGGRAYGGTAAGNGRGG